MKIILNFFFIFLLACGGKKESLTDLKSFTNQGEKIILVQNKNLNFTDINLINSLKKNKYYFYKDWSQSHQNKNNLINPVKISINKKKKISI
tara:strand:- start:3902 stop:4177 length:276 start_codon:yes stop_codon:yes gene_type:complete